MAANAGAGGDVPVNGGIKNENFAGVILESRTIQDAKGKKYTAYVIEVKPPWFFGVLPHKVMRRYVCVHCKEPGQPGHRSTRHAL